VQEFAKVIKYLNATPTGVQIAISGGGHALRAGAANIENGISLDLRKLRGVKLNSDKTIASMGAGERRSTVTQLSKYTV
jgi:FAD/FMN-containing dehydrogenase